MLIEYWIQGMDMVEVKEDKLVSEGLFGNVEGSVFRYEVVIHHPLIRIVTRLMLKSVVRLWGEEGVMIIPEVPVP